MRSKVIYDDDMDNAQVEIKKGNSEISDIVKNELSEKKKQLQVRSGRIVRPNRNKDYIYY